MHRVNSASVIWWRIDSSTIFGSKLSFPHWVEVWNAPWEKAVAEWKDSGRRAKHWLQIWYSDAEENVISSPGQWEDCIRQGTGWCVNLRQTIVAGCTIMVMALYSGVLLAPVHTHTHARWSWTEANREAVQHHGTRRDSTSQLTLHITQGVPAWVPPNPVKSELWGWVLGKDFYLFIYFLESLRWV